MCRLGARSPAPRPPLAPLRARGSARSPPAPPLLSAEVRNLGELCGVGLGTLVCSLRAPGACGFLGSGHCGAAGSAPQGGRPSRPRSWGGDIRQNLLPLSRSVPKPGFRSAQGFLQSLGELEHRQRQNRNVPETDEGQEN